MEAVIRQARTIRLADGQCRMMAQLLRKDLCDRPPELSMKYDELAEYVIQRGTGRHIGVDEPLAITRLTVGSELAHMSANSQDRIKHTCD